MAAHILNPPPVFRAELGSGPPSVYGDRPPWSSPPSRLRTRVSSSPLKTSIKKDRRGGIISDGIRTAGVYSSCPIATFVASTIAGLLVSFERSRAANARHPKRMPVSSWHCRQWGVSCVRVFCARLVFCSNCLFLREDNIYSQLPQVRKSRG